MVLWKILLVIIIAIIIAIILGNNNSSTNNNANNNDSNNNNANNNANNNNANNNNSIVLEGSFSVFCSSANPSSAGTGTVTFTNVDPTYLYNMSLKSTNAPVTGITWNGGNVDVIPTTLPNNTIFFTGLTKNATYTLDVVATCTGKPDIRGSIPIIAMC